MERIVVGVDGSPESREALARAVREARAHGGRVEAVHAWHVPPLATYPFGAIALDTTTFEGAARELLDRVVDAADTTGLDMPVERVVACGAAAEVLVEAAKGADLLVVGCRGIGGFKGLMLGSVSAQCAHHAPCPVLIVRHKDG